MIKIKIDKQPIPIGVRDPELLMNVFSDNQSLIELRFFILKEYNVDIENYTMKQIEELKTKIKDLKQKEKEERMKQEQIQKLNKVPTTYGQRVNTRGI